MLFSLALIFLLGLTLGSLLKKIQLPSLLGMLLTGILLGPYVLNLLDDSLLLISSDLRKITLIIILMRAGLSLKIKDLLKVGRPILLMSFLPACFEILAIFFIAPKLFHISSIDALMLGSVLAAVSPAVIVPKMLQLMEKGYGKNKKIPQLIMVAASVDDIFVIVLFTAFTTLAKGNVIQASDFVHIPMSIFLGLIVGILVGMLFSYFFEKIHLRDTGKVILLLCAAFLFVSLEQTLAGKIGFSGLLAVMSMGVALQNKTPERSNRLSDKFSKLWVGAEIILFVLVGATVDLQYAVATGILSVVLISFALLFRMFGVSLCMLGSTLNKKERLFCMIAYIPKATVQAAIGSIPLAMGLSSGNIILSVAVVSILFTAPLGAFLIDITHKKLLVRIEVEKNTR